MTASGTPDLAPPVPIRDLERALNRSLDGWDACPPRFVSPMPDVPGAYFDVDAVVRVCDALAHLPHTKGEWADSPFIAAPWQVVWLIGPVFGWKLPDGRRIIRVVWDEVPRKNGKSSVASRVGLVMLAADREPGAEVYAAATTETQARIVFDEAAIVGGHSSLNSRIDIRGSVIRFPRRGGKFQVLSRIAEGAHGLNVSCGIVDEVHLHKKRDLIDALETGTGARRQPLMWYITTAGDEDDTTIYAEKHGRAVRIARGDIVDPRVWVAIWAADAGDDPFAEETWRKANPNYPISPSREYLEERAQTARDTPTFLPVFKRLHLNIRSTLDVAAWNGADWWGAHAGMVPEEKLRGKPCWGGLVAASATDLSAINWTFTAPEGRGVWSLWRWFLPEELLPALDDRTNGAAGVWAREGRLRLTEGNVIDVEAHTNQLLSDALVFDVRELAFDPNGAIGITQPVESKIPLVAVYATAPGSALVDWERMLAAGEYNHGGDPIARWQVSNLMVKEASTGVWKIDRRGSRENVFGIAAAELALRRYVTVGAKKRQGKRVAGF